MTLPKDISYETNVCLWLANEFLWHSLCYRIVLQCKNYIESCKNYTENTIFHERKQSGFQMPDRHFRKIETFSTTFLYCIVPYTVKAQLFLQNKRQQKSKIIIITVWAEETALQLHAFLWQMHKRFLHTLRCTFHSVWSPATYTYHPHHKVGEQGNPESGQDKCQHKAPLPAWFAAVWNCGKQHEYQRPCQKPFNFVHFSLCRTKERNSWAFPLLPQAQLHLFQQSRWSQRDVYNCACQLIFQGTFKLYLALSLSAKFCMLIQNLLIVKPAKIYENPWKNYNDLKSQLILKPKLSQICWSFNCITTNPEFKKQPNNKTNQKPHPINAMKFNI